MFKGPVGFVLQLNRQMTCLSIYKLVLSAPMFMVNLSSEDPIYDESRPSHDSNTPFEVQDHDSFVDHMDEYHEVHEMQNDVQHNYIVDSNAEYTRDSNIIPYN
ncbi:hypothetical protein Tco_1181029 [Tanacetum coccineum]